MKFLLIKMFALASTHLYANTISIQYTGESELAFHLSQRLATHYHIPPSLINLSQVPFCTKGGLNTLDFCIKSEDDISIIKKASNRRLLNSLLIFKKI